VNKVQVIWPKEYFSEYSFLWKSKPITFTCIEKFHNGCSCRIFFKTSLCAEDRESKRGLILFPCLTVHVYLRNLNWNYSVINSSTCWSLVGNNMDFHLFFKRWIKWMWVVSSAHRPPFLFVHTVTQRNGWNLQALYKKRFKKPPVT
jgi:hypothetical protein